MKVKRIVALLLVTALCLGLCGCRVDVDELRAQHGVWDDNGNIVLNGAVYKPLPACKALQPNILVDTYAFPVPVYYVTEANVPLLAAEEEGEEFAADEQQIFLQSTFDESEPLFCREDYFDRVVEQIEHGVTDLTYHYTYTKVNENGALEDVHYSLTDEQTAQFSQLLQQCTWTLADGTTDISFDGASCVVFESRSADSWFLGQSYHVNYWPGEPLRFCLEKPTSPYVLYYCEIDPAWSDELTAIIQPVLEAEGAH
ncbi:MAG: hypothetical protein IKB04_07890 [Clostridia bacterium]|nr:hypothetical protein [Clostridia bacterium]